MFIRLEDGGIYLNYMNDNYYDVVIDIIDLFENIERNNFENEKFVKREKRCSERVIMKEEGIDFRSKKELYRKKYKENV